VIGVYTAIWDNVHGFKCLYCIASRNGTFPAIGF